MVSEKNKYKAQFHQICGLAMMTPFGKLVMDIRILTLNDLNLQLFISALIYFFFFICGMLLACRGADFLEEERVKK